jgi:predicted PurR-regulated permease PerM
MESVNLRERLFFYIVFAILIILMLLMIEPFFTVLIVSLIAVIVLKPVYDWFLVQGWVRERKALAASLTLIALFVVLIIPVLLIVWLTANQLSDAFASLAAVDVDAIIQDIQQSLADLPLAGGIQQPETSANEDVQSLGRSVAQAVAEFAVNLGSSIPDLITQGIIFIVLVATLLPIYDTLMPKLEEISPLGDEISALYNRKITAMVKSLVMGVFLIAILQGVVMGLFFWIAGLPWVFLLTLLSILLALIPMVGISWLVIGIAIVSFLSGNWQQAAIVLFGFYGVVNWIDLLLRPKLLSEDASLNTALFLLSIFAGLAWAGVMGLFYGPVIMLLLVTTIQVYAERYANEDFGHLGNAISRGSSNREAAGSQEGEPEAGSPEAEAIQASATTAPVEGADNVEPMENGDRG